MSHLEITEKYGLTGSKNIYFKPEGGTRTIQQHNTK